METNAKYLIPAVATHPGSILKQELQSRGIKQKDFAAIIGMPAPNLNELIKGKRNITEGIALKLEEALGTPFQNWMNLQNRYFYVKKRREELDAIEDRAVAEEQSLGMRINLEALYRYYQLDYPQASARLNALRERLTVDLHELQSLEANTYGYFKRTEHLRINELNMRTWLLIAKSEATKAEIAEAYSEEKGLFAATEIAQKANQGILTPTLIKDILNKNGIIYVHVPKLDAAPIDAYSMMAGSHPAIVVTYRSNDLDKLAFDVLHEIGHIILHMATGMSHISVESDYSPQSKEEKEADQFANNALIPPQKWSNIMAAKPKNLSPRAVVNTIVKEAKINGISPSIAVARYKQQTRNYNIRAYKSLKISQ